MDSSLNSYQQQVTYVHPTTHTDFTKLTQQVMSPIPERHQIRANRGIVESSQVLRGCSFQMRETVKRLTFEEIHQARRAEATKRPNGPPPATDGEPTPVYLKNYESEKQLPPAQVGKHDGSSPTSRRQMKDKPTEHLVATAHHSRQQHAPKLHSMGRQHASLMVMVGSPKEVNTQYREFREAPKLMERQLYAEFERQKEEIEKQRALGLYVPESPQKQTRIIDQDVIDRQKREEREIKKLIVSDMKKPQFYNDPKLKQKISIGANSLFERTYRQDQMKLGYTKLLSKILESNLTVRQVKNGQTLFEKEVMQRHYNNPFLELDHLKKDLKHYLEQRTAAGSQSPSRSPPPPENERSPSDKKTEKSPSPSPFGRSTAFKNPSFASGFIQIPNGVQNQSQIFEMQQTIGKLSVEQPINSTATLMSPKSRQSYQRKMAAMNPISNNQSFNLTLASTTKCTDDPSSRALAGGESLNMTQLLSKSPQLLNSLDITTYSANVVNQHDNLLQHSIAQLTTTTNSEEKRKKAHELSLPPPPFALQPRPQAQDILKQLRYPQSPAFIYNGIAQQKQSPSSGAAKKQRKLATGSVVLQDVVDYCHNQNIPFLPEEERYYRVNKFRQHQGQFQTYLDKCFETHRPDEFKVGVANLKEKITLEQAQEQKKERDDGKKHDPYQALLNPKEKELYMPKILKGLEKTLINARDVAGLFEHRSRGGEDIHSRHMRYKSQRVSTDLQGVVPPSAQQNLKGDLSFSHKKMNERLTQELSIETGEVQIEQHSQFPFKRNGGRFGNTGKTSSYSVAPSHDSKTPRNLDPMSENSSNQNAFPPQADPKHMFEIQESKRWNHILQHLPQKLDAPYREPVPPKKKRLSKRLRNDPVRKIFAVNKSVQKKKYSYNERLLRILERLEYDRPILMRDKLDVIWEKAPPKQGPPPEGEDLYKSMFKDEKSSDGERSDTEGLSGKNPQEKKMMTNEHAVKRKLERKKLERSLVNKRQIETYHKLLDHLNHRFKPIPGDQSGTVIEKFNPVKISLHEKERQFLDAYKIVIASGYTIAESDFQQILQFINIGEILFSEDLFKQVKAFILTAARYLGFSETAVEQFFDDQDELKQDTYYRDIYEKDEIEDELEDQSLINQI